jgi:choline dehydrogenase-like flavoprotein
MLIDARSFPANEVAETEVCIIGAGPAGITLARELAGQNFRVCLLESGGLEPDEEIQALATSAAETLGNREYPTAEYMRRRQLGGTANVWAIAMANRKIGVRYVPLEPIDFEQRDWLPYSGWPFDRSHLDSYYARAQEVCQVGPYAYESEDWQEQQTPPLNVPSGRITTRMFQVGSREVFTQEYLKTVQQADNITVYFHATAVELESNETASTVTRVRVACPRGPKFWIAAKVVILAQGGIDNARMLLLSDQTQKAGLGNQYDIVGRFFMDHPIVRGGMLVPNQRQLFSQTGLYDLRQVRGTHVVGQLSLSEAVLRREQLLHTTTSLFPCHPIYRFNPRRILFPQGRSYESPAVEAGIALKRAIRNGKFSAEMLKQLWQLATGVDDLVYFFGRKDGGLSLPLPQRYGYDDGGWSNLADREQRFGQFEIVHMTEQAPDPDNRVMLGAERDSLGCRKVQLCWRWNEIDRQSIVRTQKILAEEFAGAGIGRFNLELDKGDPQVIRPSAHHNMGTTRMHDNPRQGVVDRNGQVHGVSNLFITGSSVFPTSSYANPTLTIIALSIRLADHVKQMLEQSSTVNLSA